MSFLFTLLFFLFTLFGEGGAEVNNNIDYQHPRGDNDDGNYGKNEVLEPGARAAPDDQSYHEEEGNQKG